MTDGSARQSGARQSGARQSGARQSGAGQSGAAEKGAVEAALRALRHRDLSARELDERLRARGFGESEREDALERVTRTGLLDDGRFAASRARSLAARGAGDAYIRHALYGAGVAEELVEDVLSDLEPELDRAHAIAARRGVSAKTARYLSGKGFSDEAIAGVVAGRDGDELG
jgi:regulatory protein